MAHANKCTHVMLCPIRQSRGQWALPPAMLSRHAPTPTQTSKRADKTSEIVIYLSGIQGFECRGKQVLKGCRGRASKSSRIEVEMEDEAWIRDDPSFHTKWTKRRQSMWGQDEAKIQGGRRVRRLQPRREGGWETLHTGGRGLGHEKRGESRLSVGPGEVLDEVCINISAVNLR